MPSISSSPPEQAWQMVLDQLRTDMSLGSFTTWVKPVRFVSFEEGIFSLGTDSPMARDWLQDRLTSLIQRQLQGILNQPIQVRFMIVDPGKDLENETEEPQRNSVKMVLRIKKSYLRSFMSRYATFSSNPSGWSNCRFIFCAGYHTLTQR